MEANGEESAAKAFNPNLYQLDIQYNPNTERIDLQLLPFSSAEKKTETVEMKERKKRVRISETIPQHLNSDLPTKECNFCNFDYSLWNSSALRFEDRERRHVRGNSKKKKRISSAGDADGKHSLERNTRRVLSCCKMSSEGAEKKHRKKRLMNRLMQTSEVKGNLETILCSQEGNTQAVFVEKSERLHKKQKHSKCVAGKKDADTQTVRQEKVKKVKNKVANSIATSSGFQHPLSCCFPDFKKSQEVITELNSEMLSGFKKKHKKIKELRSVINITGNKSANILTGKKASISLDVPENSAPLESNLPQGETDDKQSDVSMKTIWRRSARKAEKTKKKGNTVWQLSDEDLLSLFESEILNANDIKCSLRSKSGKEVYLVFLSPELNARLMRLHGNTKENLCVPYTNDSLKNTEKFIIPANDTKSEALSCSLLEVQKKIEKSSKSVHVNIGKDAVNMSVKIRTCNKNDGSIIFEEPTQSENVASTLTSKREGCWESSFISSSINSRKLMDAESLSQSEEEKRSFAGMTETSTYVFGKKSSGETGIVVKKLIDSLKRNFLECIVPNELKNNTFTQTEAERLGKTCDKSLLLRCPQKKILEDRQSNLKVNRATIEPCEILDSPTKCDLVKYYATRRNTKINHRCRKQVATENIVETCRKATNGFPSDDVAFVVEAIEPPKRFGFERRLSSKTALEMRQIVLTQTNCCIIEVIPLECCKIETAVDSLEVKEVIDEIGNNSSKEDEDKLLETKKHEESAIKEIETKTPKQPETFRISQELEETKDSNQQSNQIDEDCKALEGRCTCSSDVINTLKNMRSVITTELNKIITKQDLGCQSLNVFQNASTQTFPEVTCQKASIATQNKEDKEFWTSYLPKNLKEDSSSDDFDQSKKIKKHKHRSKQSTNDFKNENSVMGKTRTVMENSLCGTEDIEDEDKAERSCDAQLLWKFLSEDKSFQDRFKCLLTPNSFVTRPNNSLKSTSFATSKMDSDDKTTPFFTKSFKPEFGQMSSFEKRKMYGESLRAMNSAMKKSVRQTPKISEEVVRLDTVSASCSKQNVRKQRSVAERMKKMRRKKNVTQENPGKRRQTFEFESMNSLHESPSKRVKMKPLEGLFLQTCGDYRSVLFDNQIKFGDKNSSVGSMHDERATFNWNVAKNTYKSFAPNSTYLEARPVHEITTPLFSNVVNQKHKSMTISGNDGNLWKSNEHLPTANNNENLSDSFSTDSLETKTGKAEGNPTGNDLLISTDRRLAEQRQFSRLNWKVMNTNFFVYNSQIRYERERNDQKDSSERETSMASEESGYESNLSRPTTAKGFLKKGKQIFNFFKTSKVKLNIVRDESKPEQSLTYWCRIAHKNKKKKGEDASNQPQTETPSDNVAGSEKDITTESPKDLSQNSSVKYLLGLQDDSQNRIKSNSTIESKHPVSLASSRLESKSRSDSQYNKDSISRIQHPSVSSSPRQSIRSGTVENKESIATNSHLKQYPSKSENGSQVSSPLSFNYSSQFQSPTEVQTSFHSIPQIQSAISSFLEENQPSKPESETTHSEISTQVEPKWKLISNHKFDNLFRKNETQSANSQTYRQIPSQIIDERSLNDSKGYTSHSTSNSFSILGSSGLQSNRTPNFSHASSQSHSKSYSNSYSQDNSHSSDEPRAQIEPQREDRQVQSSNHSMMSSEIQSLLAKIESSLIKSNSIESRHSYSSPPLRARFHPELESKIESYLQPHPWYEPPGYGNYRNMYDESYEKSPKFDSYRKFQPPQPEEEMKAEKYSSKSTSSASLKVTKVASCKCHQDPLNTKLCCFPPKPPSDYHRYVEGLRNQRQRKADGRFKQLRDFEEMKSHPCPLSDALKYVRKIEECKLYAGKVRLVAEMNKEFGQAQKDDYEEIPLDFLLGKQIRRKVDVKPVARKKLPDSILKIDHALKEELITEEEITNVVESESEEELEDDPQFSELLVAKDSLQRISHVNKEGSNTKWSRLSEESEEILPNLKSIPSKTFQRPQFKATPVNSEAFLRVHDASSDELKHSVSFSDEIHLSASSGSSLSYNAGGKVMISAPQDIGPEPQKPLSLDSMSNCLSAECGISESTSKRVSKESSDDYDVGPREQKRRSSVESTEVPIEITQQIKETTEDVDDCKDPEKVKASEIGKCFKRGFRPDNIALSGEPCLTLTKSQRDVIYGDLDQKNSYIDFSERESPLEFLLGLGFSVDEASNAIKDEDVKNRLYAAITEARVWVNKINTTQGTLLYLVSYKTKPKTMRYFLQLVEAIINLRIVNAVKLDGFLRLLEKIEDGNLTMITILGMDKLEDEQDEEKIVKKQLRQLFYDVYTIAKNEAIEKGIPLTRNAIILLRILAAKYRAGLLPHLELIAKYIGQNLLVNEVQLEAAMIYLSRLDTAQVKLNDFEEYCAIRCPDEDTKKYIRKESTKKKREVSSISSID